jgi:hypothetical protein
MTVSRSSIGVALAVAAGLTMWVALLNAFEMIVTGKNDFAMFYAGAKLVGTADLTMPRTSCA